MTQRIIFSSSGVKVSKPGVDASTATNRYLSMHPGMDPMRPIYTNTVTFSGVGQQDFSIPNPTEVIPFVMLRDDSGFAPSRSGFCAELWYPYNVVRIRNVSGRPRTIIFTVLL